tara:strand:+ start:90 stop:437 length:348 start_codon:yes stop_codon:yes gene_type:complete
MAKDNFFYFHESGTAPDSPGEAAVYRSSMFLGADTSAADTVRLHFMARNGAAQDDAVALKIGSVGTMRECFRRIAQAMSSSKGGFFIDDEVQNLYTLLDGGDKSDNPVVITTTNP